MKLAVFDLDDTLLPIDTGHLWMRWVADHSGLDPEPFLRRSDEFNAAYRAGSFDADELVRFNAQFLARFERSRIDAVRDAFLEEVVRPAVRPEGLALVEAARAEGFVPLLATGTMHYVTARIAAFFGIEHVAAVTLEEGPDGRFTGNFIGSHSYGPGKLRLVHEFIRALPEAPEVVRAWSDSINDLPLLEFAASWRPEGAAIAVNPDDALRRVAVERGWSVMDIFKGADHV